MSVKNSYTTADYLEWDTAMALIRKLYKDGDYRFSLLIGCGCFFGLRISDLRKLTWSMLIDDESFMLKEQKTDLCTAIDQLMECYKTGEKVMLVYKQMKMYNDPALNPVLYGQKQL